MQAKDIPTHLFNQILTEPFKIRFWSKVKINGPDECWDWSAGKSCGYGRVMVGKPKERMEFKAHRIAWMIHHGVKVPDDLFILHSCIGNKACCNPAHLRPGTQLENMEDRKAQGRESWLHGELQPNHVLTGEVVSEIRKTYSEGGLSMAKVAARFGTHHSQVWKIVRRKIWKLVP